MFVRLDGTGWCTKNKIVSNRLAQAIMQAGAIVFNSWTPSQWKQKMVSGVWYLLHRSWVPCFLRQQSTLLCIYGNLQGILHATDTRLTQATCHTSCKSHSWIQRGMSCQEKFVATKITRPTHLFFYLWDNLKAKVYANNPKTLEGQYSEWNWKNWSNLAV